ncbi:hypothetical protein ACYQR9_15470 [Methylobacterium sp. CM6241]
MSDVDCLTQFENAVVAHLETRLGGAVKRVLTPEDAGPDRPIPKRFLPCILVVIGAESPGAPGPNEGGQDRLVPQTVQVDVMVATDGGEKGFNAKVRTIAFAVRTAMADLIGATCLPLDESAHPASRRHIDGGALTGSWRSPPASGSRPRSASSPPPAEGRDPPLAWRPVGHRPCASRTRPESWLHRTDGDPR